MCHNTHALQYASKALKADKEVGLAAVSQKGRALQYASKEVVSMAQSMLRGLNENLESVPSKAQYGQALNNIIKKLSDDTNFLEKAFGGKAPTPECVVSLNFLDTYTLSEYQSIISLFCKQRSYYTNSLFGRHKHYQKLTQPFEGEMLDVMNLVMDLLDLKTQVSVRSVNRRMDLFSRLNTSRQDDNAAHKAARLS